MLCFDQPDVVPELRFERSFAEFSGPLKVNFIYGPHRSGLA